MWLGNRVALRDWRRWSAVRVGVVVCVSVAVALCALRLDEVLGLFDWRADRNASLGYLERVYADNGIAGSRRVVEDAIAWMPEEARYRVVVGPNLRVRNPFTARLVSDFLQYFLLPRRQTDAPSAPWVFCYGCEAASLGERFVLLSDGGNGVRFGRIRR